MVANFFFKQGTEFINEQGAIQIKVETDDKQSPALENKEPGMEDVGVGVNLNRDGPNSGAKGGVVASAVDAIAKASESAKHVISGSVKAAATNK